MQPREQPNPFLEKARQSLLGAESEFAAGRYDNCANRAYYSTFQAAIAALQQAGFAPRGSHGQWSHAYVPSQFEGQLVNRRKLYPAELRGVLGRNLELRQVADYREGSVSATKAERALRRTRSFVRAIRESGDLKMNAKRSPGPAKLDQALEELKARIRESYPDATFCVERSPDDPDAILLVTTVDLDDTDQLMDLIIDRMMEIQIEDDLPIFVVPVRPRERVLAELEASAKGRQST